MPLTTREKLLRDYPELVDGRTLKAFLATVPFVVLKTLLDENNVNIPKDYAFAVKKLPELTGSDAANQTYTMRIEGKAVSVSKEEYKDMLEKILAEYEEESYFKNRLRGDINKLVGLICSNQDTITEHKRMDDHWVKSALTDIRSQLRTQRKTLDNLLLPIREYLEKNRAAQAENSHSL